MAAALLVMAACQSSTPPPATAVAPRAAPAANAPAAAAPKPALPGATTTIAKAPVALPSMDLPPGPLYTCDVRGERTPIEYAPNVESLCRRHPEMGPCQYERYACRSRGGRVFTAKGDEVTPAVEAAYDEKVLRVRFRGDDGPPK